jgi:hypothetical protein
MGEKPKLASADSKVYRATLYGILNADGDFWTPLAFESDEAAKAHIRGFWKRQPDMAERCLRDFKFVPVRVRLDQLEEAPNG